MSGVLFCVLGNSCTNVIPGHFCFLGYYCTDIRNHCCAKLSCINVLLHCCSDVIIWPISAQQCVPTTGVASSGQTGGETEIFFIHTRAWSRVSSGSIVSDYGLEDRAIGVRSPAEAEDFSSSLCIQTGSGAHLASCPMGTGVLSPGVKARWGVTLTTHPHLVPRSRMSRSYTSSPPKRLHGV
jgi:hypothetical protein